MSAVGSDILLSSGTNEVEFLEFFLAGGSYGINVAKVKHVASVESVTITPMPEEQESVAGVVHFEGKPIKVIDLRDALNLDGPETDENRRLVLFATFNRQVTGFLIDGVQKIHRCSWESFQPIENNGGTAQALTGTILVNDEVILILDMERLLARFGCSAHEVDADADAPEDLKTLRGGKHIVYAEDSPMIRNLTEKMLRKAGYTSVISFSDGAQAAEYIDELAEAAAQAGETLRERVDVILTDIEMPRMDGLTLCKRVKDRGEGAHIPSVMVYSSLINQEMSVKCKRVGADVQLSKPHGNEIVEVLDKLCGFVADD